MSANKTSQSTVEPGSTYWCIGLPEKSRRMLTEEEKRTLMNERRHALRKIRMYLLYIPIFAITVAAILAVSTWILGHRNSDLMGSAIMIVLFVLVGWPLLLLPASGQFKTAAGRKRDLQNGAVSQFAGILDQRLYDIPSISSLRKARLLHPADGSRVEIDVLKESSTVLSLNGKVIIERSIKADIVSVANPPHFSNLAAKYVQPTEQDGRYRHQRTLNDDEKAELQRHYRKTSNPRATIWTIFLLIAGPGALLFFLVRGAHFSSMIGPACITVLALLSLSRIIRELKIALNLKKDLKSGFIVIEKYVKKGSSPESSPAYEYLPHTQLLWIENRRPAGWRTY